MRKMTLIHSKDGVKIFGEINPATKKLGPFEVEHWSINKNSPNRLFSTYELAEKKKDQIVYDYIIKPRQDEMKKLKKHMK